MPFEVSPAESQTSLISAHAFQPMRQLPEAGGILDPSEAETAHPADDVTLEAALKTLHFGVEIYRDWATSHSHRIS